MRSIGNQCAKTGIQTPVQAPYQPQAGRIGNIWFAAVTFPRSLALPALASTATAVISLGMEAIRLANASLRPVVSGTRGRGCGAAVAAIGKPADIIGKRRKNGWLGWGCYVHLNALLGGDSVRGRSCTAAESVV